MGDPLSRAPLLAVASLEAKAGARIRLAAPLDPASLIAGVVEQVETQFDAASGSVLARRRRRLGALILEDRTEKVDPAQAASLLANAMPIGDLPWSDAAHSLRARVALMRGLEGEAWPDWSDAALSADREWLIQAVAGGRDMARLDLNAALRGRLAWAMAARLDEALPTHLTLPGGRAAIDYLADVPLASAKVQAFYGLAETPRLAGGRIALRLALLSPAARPVAITADLAGFWRGGWNDVRRDMRGRYPRHDWRESPQGERPRDLSHTKREANSARTPTPGTRK